MRRVGTAVRTAQGMLVLEANDDPPAPGTEVVTAELTTVGSVVEYFGPVTEPYVLVDPTADTEAASLLGQPLYAR